MLLMHWAPTSKACGKAKLLNPAKGKLAEQQVPDLTCAMRFWSFMTSVLHSADMSCSSREFCAAAAAAAADRHRQ
jgi:hypothetical protein